MKNVAVVILILVFSFVGTLPCFGGEQVSKAELEQLLKVTKELRRRVEQLEKKLQTYEAKEKQLEAKQQELEKAKEEVSGIKKALGNIEIAADITVVAQGTINNDDNAKRAGMEGKDKLDAAWSMDLDISSKIGENGTAFLKLEAGQGDAVNDEVAAISGIDDDAPETSDPTVEVTEAWYEHSFNKVPLVATIGKVDLTNYFDANEVANDETTQFLSSGFVNNMAIEFPDDNGLGARITYSPTRLVDISVGWGEADADFEDIVDDGFGMFEIDMKPTILGKPGNYRFYAWINGYNHSDTGDLKDVAEGTMTLKDVDDNENNWGAGFSFDQSVCKDVALFLRGGIMDDDVVRFDGADVESAPIKGAISGGFRVGGSYWGRDGDRFAVAFGTVFLDDELEGYFGLPDDIGDEHHLELYYTLSLLEGGLELSPDLQVIWNPGGDSDADTVTVGGVRMQVNF